MKKLIAILIAVVMLLSLSAMAEESIKIGYTISDLSNPFFVTLEQGIKDHCAELGLEEPIGFDSAYDTGKDLTNVQDLIELGVDVILFNPVDEEAGIAAVEFANKAGVPVITMDRGTNGGEVKCHVASDNVFGAELACKFIVEQLGEEGGAVAEIQGMAGASSANDRHQGFDNVMGAAENIEVVVSQIGDWDETKAMGVMEDALTSNPEIKAVFCANDLMALGAVQACKVANREDIIVVGFDAIDAALAAVEDGSMAATIEQLPAQIGVTAVDQALAVLAGEEVPAFVGVEVALITK